MDSVQKGGFGRGFFLFTISFTILRTFREWIFLQMPKTNPSSLDIQYLLKKGVWGMFGVRPWAPLDTSSSVWMPLAKQQRNPGVLISWCQLHPWALRHSACVTSPKQKGWYRNVVTVLQGGEAFQYIEPCHCFSSFSNYTILLEAHLQVKLVSFPSFYTNVAFRIQTLKFPKCCQKQTMKKKPKK